MATKELRSHMRQALKQFLDSKRKVQILYSTQSPITTTKSLYVLDSSFNPPSLAHVRMARSALTGDQGPGPTRLLFLIATANADKSAKLDTYEDRLVMMQLCADEMQQEMRHKTPENVTPIDVGVTKEAYFHNKAAAIDEEKLYPGAPQQIHLVGFDTTVRIFNTKYYTPDHTFSCLEPMFNKHRLRVTLRTDDEWGDQTAQEQYIQDIADGKREHEGAKREWAKNIQLVQGKRADEKPVSSTRARSAAKKHDWETLETLVPSSVQQFIQSEGLYVDD